MWQRVITHPDLAAAPQAERGSVELDWIRSRRLRGAPAEQRPRLREILDRADELPDELANQARLELVEIDMATDQQEHARALARHVVEFHEANGTPHDPLATRARYALANADMTLGLLERNPDWDRWPKAEADLRALLTEQEKDLGMRNIVTLTTRTAIGWALISQGEVRRARDHAKAVLAVLGRRTGTGHPLYLRCAYVLGMAYCQLGKFPQAVAHLDAAHRGQVITLGVAHPETLRTQFELAMALKLEGRQGKARGNTLLTGVWKLSPKATGRLNDLYGQAVFAVVLARHAPVWLLRWAHRSNHKHKWTEEQPAGYRCRHGHTSAQRATPDRPKNLYVREDHILANLPAHLAVLELDDELGPEERGSGDSGQRRDLAELMRQFDLTIVCDTAGWTAETATATDDFDR